MFFFEKEKFRGNLLKSCYYWHANPSINYFNFQTYVVFIILFSNIKIVEENFTQFYIKKKRNLDQRYNND